MLQEQATGYRDTPVFTYQPSTAGASDDQHVDLGELSSGVYFLRLQSDGEVRTQKLTVVR